MELDIERGSARRGAGLQVREGERMIGLRVAIAIPAYNAARTVGETLDALQANKAFDRTALVVLLDDCSMDGTAEVARKHWRSPVPLKVWRNAENMGERRTTNAAMTVLADMVDWTFILHADDVVKPNWIALYLDEIPRLPANVASICSSYDNWWPETGRTRPGEDRPGAPAVHVAGERAEVIGTIDRGCWWHISGCGLRNKAFLEVGGFEPDMAQLGDWEWLLRCLAKGYGVWYLPRTTMLYRQHASSVSSRSFREARDIRERLHILRVMRSQGYLGTASHKAYVRNAIRQLARRSFVRITRGDAIGLKAHASLFVATAADYVRGRL
jgi:GT2 family glycosyltransferase